MGLAELEALAAQVRQWGRFGPDDERGTLNLIDDAARRRGVASVRRGHAVPLAMPFSEKGVQAGFIHGRLNPIRLSGQVHTPVNDHEKAVAFSDDLLIMGVQAGTHWDALAHATWRGHHWNGRPVSATNANDGATRAGASTMGPLTSRGVLLDVPRALGLDRLGPTAGIGPDELDAALELAKVALAPGDVVLLRTGHSTRLPNLVDYWMQSPGPTPSAVPWFKANDVAAVATDSAVFERYPTGEDEVGLPVHALDLVEVGLVQGQNFALEGLAAACADEGRWSFLLEATPLPIVGACGAPVAPVAVL